MIKKILVSQPEPTSEKSPYFEIAKKFNVDFVFHPFIQVEQISAREFRQQKVGILDHTAIVFNSRHAIEHFFSLCKEMRVALPDDMKYFGISEKVILYIQKYVQYRKRKVFFGTSGKWPELVTVMAKHKAEKYLVPLSDVHNGEVRNMLDTKKLKHTECVMYRTVSAEFAPDALADIDMVVLFTPAGVHSLVRNFPNLEPGKPRIACWGESTVQAAKEAGLRIDLKAPSENAPSITRSIELYLEEENK